LEYIATACKTSDLLELTCICVNHGI